MGTRSRIGIEVPNGAVYSIYCHWDGYVSHNGRILFDYYQDEAKIRELMDLGDISSLGENIGEKHDFDKHDSKSNECNAYGRDRNETDVDCRVDDNSEQFLAGAEDGWEEYVYLWKDGHWWVSGVGGGAGPFLVSNREIEWKLLEDALKEDSGD